MSHLAERTLIHYSKNKLTNLKNTTTDQEKLLHFLGKPTGLWYAYGEDWKEFIKNKKSGHTVNNTKFRYEFTLPEDTFITDVNKESLNSILVLSKENFDNFMETYINQKDKYSMYQIVETAINKTPQDGKSSILSEIANILKDDVFDEYYQHLINLYNFEDNNGNYQDNDNKNNDNINIEDIREILFDRIPEDYVPSNEALKDDRIIMYNWKKFWNNVSNKVGGIEFDKDLFDIKKWRDIHIPWIDKIEIRSGIIFHPSTFRDGILKKQLELQQMVGGKKRKQHTRCKRSNIRKRKTKKMVVDNKLFT